MLRLTGQAVGEVELMNSLVLYYVHGLNPFIAQPALIQDPSFCKLLKARLRGETAVPGALAGALQSLIAGFQ